MGLFDKLKKQLKQESQKKQIKREMYAMPVLYSEEEIMVFGVNKIDTVKHRNNEMTDLMMARILKQNPEYTLYMDFADYITFELPKGMEVNDEIMQTVMNQYEQEKQKDNEQQQYYIGRLTRNKNGYSFSNKSETVKNIVDNIIKQKIHERKEFIERAREEQENKEAERRKQFMENMDAKSYIDEIEETRNRRKQNPILKKAYTPYYNKDLKTYYNYDGININTGDILRIRQVDKVGKDGSGTYLYSAHIYNTPNEDDVELLNMQDIGFSVCFELQKKLEDIVKDGNPDEIVQVLQLLSDERNFENSEQLNYIGEIDKSGRINRKTISSSPAIQSAIVKMQKDFAENIKRQQEGR